MGEGGCLPYSLTAVNVPGSNHVLLSVHVIALQGGLTPVPTALLDSAVSTSTPILQTFLSTQWAMIQSPNGRYLAGVTFANTFGEGPEEIRIYDLRAATSTLREPFVIDPDRYVSVPSHGDITEVGTLAYPLQWVDNRTLRVSTIQHELHSFEEQQESQKYFTIRF